MSDRHQYFQCSVCEKACKPISFTRSPSTVLKYSDLERNLCKRKFLRTLQYAFFPLILWVKDCGRPDLWISGPHNSPVTITYEVPFSFSTSIKGRMDKTCTSTKTALIRAKIELEQWILSQIVGLVIVYPNLVSLCRSVDRLTGYWRFPEASRAVQNALPPEYITLR